MDGNNVNGTDSSITKLRVVQSFRWRLFNNIGPISVFLTVSAIIGCILWLLQHFYIIILVVSTPFIATMRVRQTIEISENGVDVINELAWNRKRRSVERVQWDDIRNWIRVTSNGFPSIRLIGMNRDIDIVPGGSSKEIEASLASVDEGIRRILHNPGRS